MYRYLSTVIQMQQAMREIRLIRRFVLLFCACVLCLMFWTTKIADTSQHPFDYADLAISEDDSSDYCEGELFSYRHISIVDSKKIVQRGKPFNCSKIEYLKKFNLTRSSRISNIVQSNYPKDLIFVSAVNTGYFPSVRAAFATVRKHFGPKNKFILYDLGGVEKLYGAEIKKMCNLELRKFDFKQMPKNVRNIQTFSWKVFILADVFNEATNIMYLDSSIYFESSQFDVFFDMMSHGFRLTPFQMSGYTGHSIQFATHKDMYRYIPFDENLAKTEQRMLEANLLLLHRSESTRQILKWAVLCASTFECIDPAGTEIICDIARKHETAVCHRQDQSLFSILTHNLEQTYRRYKFPIVLGDDKEHPGNTKQRHQSLRGQVLFKKQSLSC